MARMPKPWYRASARRWYMSQDGQQLPLPVRDPDDEAGAWAAVRALISGAVADAAKAPVQPGTVLQLVPKFLDAKRADVTPRTLKGYGQYLGWLSKHFQGSVAALDLAAVKAQAAKEEWSDTHRANTFWCVNGFLKWCGRLDRLAPPAKETRGGDAVIPAELHARILNETQGDFRALCNFLWLTGCRPGEATSLVAEAVDWENRTAKLKKHKTKHKGKTRVLYLCAEALGVLVDQALKYDGAGYLFRGVRGRPLSLQAMTMRFERLSEKLGRRVCSYDYRHSFATRALAAVESDTIVAALLGHTSTRMIHKAYSHVSEQSRTLKDAANRIAGKRSA